MRYLLLLFVALAALEPCRATAASSETFSALLDSAAAAVRDGRKAEALALLAKSEALELGDGELLSVASLYEDLGEYCGASRVGARAVRRNPKSPGPLLVYADAAAYCGQHQEAMIALAAARRFELDQDLAELIPYLYVYMGEYRQALASSDEYVRRYPADVWHWFRRTEAAIGAGDRGAAELALKKITALTQATKGEIPKLDEIYSLLDRGPEANRIAWILISCPERIAAASTEAWIKSARISERRLSLKALLQAQKLRPKDWERKKNITRIYLDIARQETNRAAGANLHALVATAPTDAEQSEDVLPYAEGYELAHTNDAAAPLFAALFDRPEDVEFRELLRSWAAKARPTDAVDSLITSARGDVRAGRRDAARVSLERAEVAVTDDRRLRAIAFLETGSGAYDRALVILGRLLISAPNDADILIAQAQAAVGAGQRSLALAALERAERVVADAGRLRTIALLDQDAGDSRRTLAILDRLQVSAPKDAQLFLDRGVAQFMIGDMEKSVQAFTAAIALDPRRGDAYLSLGAAYEKRGDDSKALAAYAGGAALKDVDVELRDMLLKKRSELLAKPRASSTP